MKKFLTLMKLHKRLISVLLMMLLLFSAAAQADPPDAPPGSPPGAPGGGSSGSVNYTAATTITSAAEESGQTYSSTASDECALMIATSDTVSISRPTVTKTGSSDGGDNCNFYGLNAAVLVKDGSTTTITGGTISSSASGANGVFCYGGNGGTNGAAGTAPRS